ncbi:uncharacterized protein LOC122309867 [Carya illinoinensis]|uniref:uncharacterized protein LOC122309867 n=1 Tax=Carya illinoinensis TaxID=32201 RepID=UPI001C727A3E|nr:uncharacterized protein LOC122309867 [Carya illinoinensis]
MNNILPALAFATAWIFGLVLISGSFIHVVVGEVMLMTLIQVRELNLPGAKERSDHPAQSASATNKQDLMKGNPRCRLVVEVEEPAQAGNWRIRLQSTTKKLKPESRTLQLKSIVIAQCKLKKNASKKNYIDLVKLFKFEIYATINISYSLY